MNPTVTFVDVGANVGYFSLLAAKLLPSGKVIAFEAFPSIYEKLNRNIALNRYVNIEAHNIAVTDVKKEVAMYHSTHNEGATTSKVNNYNELPTEYSDLSVTVQGAPLPDMIPNSEIDKIRLIKIDVEGAEYDVLSGMYPLISRLPVDAEIIVEITPEVLTPEQLTDIFDSMAKFGFTAYQIENTYSPDYYMNFGVAQEPCLLLEKPENQLDILFTRKKST